MNNPTIKPTHKQFIAWQKLQDKTTRIVAYGGAAGGGKSWLGCEWLLTQCFFYDNTRWFIGRDELKTLRGSTLITFFKVVQYHKIPSQYISYNGQDHYLKVFNSRIDLLELKYYPSDPLYERYGSAEYTGGWIEEGGEVDFGAYDTLKSRVGRQYNDLYGILPKILITCNPKKNWLYTEFYKPSKEGTLETDKAFIQAFVQDNDHISKDYIESLKSIKDKAKKERLLFGNWEYDDDPSALIDYDAINDLFTNDYIPEGDKYITADIARFGKDTTCIMVWSGMRVKDIRILQHSSVSESANAIKELSRIQKISMSKVIVDEDGVGGGVVDILKCKGFVNNSRALNEENYSNLKSQCYYKLSDYINDRKIYIEKISEKQKEDLTEELEQVKQKDVDSDGKKAVMPKEKVKELIGRSPDLSDCLMMRMYFEIGPKSINRISVIK